MGELEKPPARFGELEVAPTLLIPSDEKNSARVAALGDGIGKFCKSGIFKFCNPRSFMIPGPCLSIFFLKKLPNPDPALVDEATCPAPMVLDRSIFGLVDGGIGVDAPGLFVCVVEEPTADPPSLPLLRRMPGGLMAADAPPGIGIVIDVERAPVDLAAESVLVRAGPAGKLGVAG